MKETYGGVSLSSIIKQVEKLLEIWSQMPENPEPEKKSGYFTLMCKDVGSVLLIKKFGNQSSEEDDVCCYLSQKQAKEIFYRKKSSVDPSCGRGRAIYKTDDVFILSFYGLCNKQANEAITLVLAELWGVRKMSLNPFYFPLMKKAKIEM